MFFIFGKKILSEERKKALNEFRKQAVKALEELEKSAKDEFEKGIYSAMSDSIRQTPIYFFPRKSLRESIHKFAGMVFGSVVKGENVKSIRIVQQGKRFFIQSLAHINLPAEHVFEGSNLTIAGIFTLCHEYAHFPKPGVSSFAFHNNLSLEQAEELLSDVLAAKLAKKIGYSRQTILEQISGREIVYGSIPFKKMVLKALE